MKIGVIGNALDALEGMESALREYGHEPFTVSVAQGSAGYADLARFLLSAARLDLIYNTDGPGAVVLHALTSTPLVTLLTSRPEPEELALYAGADGDCHFIAEAALGELPGLHLAARIDTVDSHSLSELLGIFEDLASRAEREEQRPWGFYEVLSDDQGDHKIKRITVWPGGRLSLQKHSRRREHWIVITGRALVTVGEHFIECGPSESVDIPCGQPHRIENVGDEPLVFIEVQQGDYFGEDDILRLEDDYGRT